jgi:cbb3-type cytochrome c oxidase subunit III
VTTGLLAIYAALYLWGVARYEQHTRRRFPRAIVAAEFVGLVALWIAIVGLDAWADASFAAHMVQHVILIAIVAPALVLGAPLRVLLGAVPRSQARAIGRFLRTRIVRMLTAPPIAWLAYVAVLWVAHYSNLYELALEHPPVHIAEHVAFLASAALFWSHAFPVAPLPARLAPPARALYLFLAGPSSAFLGLSLWSSHGVLYPHYLHVTNPFGLSPLEDQRAGGLIMWVSGSVMTLTAVLAVLARWARIERRAIAACAIASACSCVAATPARASAAVSGKIVYAVHCASCHGADLRGGPDAPSIRGVGAADVDWWVATGRMPAAIPWVQQPRRPLLLSLDEVQAVVAYVVSVAPGGPRIPNVQTNGNLQRGRQLFAENCEHCHGADAQGNSIGSDYVAPDLAFATPTQIGEAVRAGVGMMPKFGEHQISSSDLNDIATYVDWVRSRRQTPGGIDLSSIGPFGEGAVAWLVVTLGVTGYAWFLGTRMQRANETKEPEPVD